jgi:hypothetical protein
MPSYDRALWALRTWLDSWSGIGRIAVGMARQGFDLQLTRYDDRGWRATFYTTGKEHSPTSATGTPSERTPWDAVQWPTRETLKRMTDYFAAPPLFGTFRDRCGHCPAHGDEPMPAARPLTHIMSFPHLVAVNVETHGHPVQRHHCQHQFLSWCDWLFASVARSPVSQHLPDAHGAASR